MRLFTCTCCGQSESTSNTHKQSVVFSSLYVLRLRVKWKLKRAKRQWCHVDANCIGIDLHFVSQLCAYLIGLYTLQRVEANKEKKKTTSKQQQQTETKPFVMLLETIINKQRSNVSYKEALSTVVLSQPT